MLIDFVAYSASELTGILKGLNIQNLLHNVVTPFFIVAGIMSLLMTGLAWGSGKIGTGAKHFAIFLLTSILWFTPTNVLIGLVDLSGYLSRYGLPSTEVKNNYSAKGHLYDALLFLPEMGAYGISYALLGEEIPTDIQQRLITDPSLIFALGAQRFIAKGRTPEEVLERIGVLAYCLDAETNLKKLYPDDPVAREIIRFLNEEVEKPNYGCYQFYESGIPDMGEYFDDVRSVIRDYIYDKKAKEAWLNFIDTIEGSWKVKNSFWKGPEYPPMRIEPISEGIAKSLYSVFKAVRTENSLSNFAINANRGKLGAAVASVASDFQTFISNLALDKGYNFNLMLTLQKLYEGTALAIFPFILILSLLPVSGYNLGLLGRFLLSWLGLKLWVPLFVWAHLLLIGNWQYSDFTGKGEIGEVISQAYLTAQTGEMVQTVLNILAIGIPVALGAVPLMWSLSGFISATKVSLYTNAQLFNQIKSTVLSAVSIGAGAAAGATGRGFISGSQTAQFVNLGVRGIRAGIIKVKESFESYKPTTSRPPKHWHEGSKITEKEK